MSPFYKLVNFSFFASKSSILLFLIAEETTKIVAFLIFAEACPRKKFNFIFF